MILKLDRVTRIFKRGGQPLWALRNVSLDLFEGEFVGIFGPSCAGKTTLLRIAAGLDPPDEGRVIYEGHPLNNCSRKEIRLLRRRYTGCIWGASSLNPGLSVFDNVAVKALVEEVNRAAAVRLAYEFIEVCAVDHLLDARPGELSAGERRRVAIAQALVTEPQLILGDEITQGLDIFEQEFILDLLKSLAHEVNVGILITDSDAMGLAKTDRIHYLKEGIMSRGASMGGLGDKKLATHKELSEHVED